MKTNLIVFVAFMAIVISVRSEESGQTVSQPAGATAPATRSIVPVDTVDFVPPAPRQPLSAIAESQVISRSCVLEGGRTITLEHIQPPDLPDPPNIAHPATLNLTPEEMAARRDAWLAYRRAHPMVNVNLSGTIYDHSTTLLRWKHGDAKYQAWSNVDFNLLRGLTQVEMNGTTYRLFMMFSDFSTAPLTLSTGRVITPKAPAIPPLPETPGFVVVQGDSSNDDALRVIRELHDYYNNNRDQLVAVHERQLRYQAAAKAWEKEHPPQPENITVRFWNMSAQQAAELKGGAQP